LGSSSFVGCWRNPASLNLIVRRLDIQLHFALQTPRVDVPYGITESELVALAGPLLRHVAKGYFTIECTSLPGLTHQLGFHFEPRSNGRLVELEFFGLSQSDQAASYNEFQRSFERYFGKPSRTTLGDGGFPNHEWVIGGVSIRHFVLERFGPEEHMRVRWNGV
jgi:hypothetical protein